MQQGYCCDLITRLVSLRRWAGRMVFSFLLLGQIIAIQAVAQYRFDQFTANNGLPQNTVNAITQTHDGYLWFATFDGLVRFDGVHFTIFDKGNSPGISNNRFLTLCEDAQGTLWAGTVEGGLLRYRDGIFKAFTTEEGLPRNHIARVQINEDGLLIISVNNETKKLTMAADESFVEVETRTVNQFVDHANARWVLDKGQLIRFKNGEQIAFPVNLRPDEFLRYRYEDRAGNLWLGSEDQGLYQISGNRLNHYLYDKNSSASHRVRVGGEDREGNLWVFSDKQLLRFHDNRFIPCFSPDGFDGAPIRSVFCDREGTVWVGTDGQGLYRLSRQFLTAYSVKDGLLDNNVYPVYEDRQGAIWIGASQSGITRFADGKFTVYRLARREQNGKSEISVTGAPGQGAKVNVDAFYQDNSGQLWVGIGGGLVTLNGNKLTDYSSILDSPKESTEAILQDRSGTLWFGTTKGLFKMRDGKVTGYFTSAGLPGHAITALLEDHAGTLWVGTRDGLARFDGERFTAFTTNQGLVGNRIRCLYEDADGVLWIGTTDSGLSRYQDGRFTSYTVQDGLFNNGVFQILEDRRGIFWMSCNRGIYRVSRQQLNDFAGGKLAAINCVAYGNQDGMLSIECNGGRQPAGVKTRDGRLWFPTQGGVVVIDPEAIVYNSEPPVVTIESVSVASKEVNFKQGVFIEPYQTDLEINYNAPSSIKAEYTRFKYKLEGLSDDWIDAGTRRSVHYSQLPPGQYSFRIIAVNSDGVWNETGMAFDIHMKPYFYQTRLFIALWIVLAVAAALCIYGLRVRRLKANERRLTILVAERTAELVERTEQLEVANEKLEQLATLDGLTNIANRRRFTDFLTAEWQRAQRQQSPLSLLLMDVDYFKLYNDTYGHQNGDECLRKVASVLRQIVKRPADLVARYGGEEFAVILAHTDEQGAAVLAERIRLEVEALRIPHAGSKVASWVTTSIGVATSIPGAGEDPDCLIAAADEALYLAKGNGRNRCQAKAQVWV